MDKLKPREKLLIGALIIIGILYVYVKLLYLPLKAQITDTMASIAQKKVENQNLVNMQAENKSLKTELQGLNSVYLASMNLLPQSEKNPEIYFNMSKIASPLKVSLMGVTIGTPGDPQGSNSANTQQNAQQNTKQNTAQANTSAANAKWKFMSVPVSFQAAGDYASIMQYIHNLENDTRQCQILSVNLVQGNDKTGVSATIAMEYYYMDQGTFDLQYDFNKGTYGKDTLFK